MKINLFFILMIVLFLSSCTKRNLEKTEEVSTKGYSLDQALDEYVNKTVDFETMAIKAKCKYQDEDRNVSFTANFRLKKDEIIWVSATLFGIEGARAYITPDSVKVVSRLERSYYEESIEGLQEITGLPVNFEMLQNMVTAKILLVDDNSKLSQSEGFYELATTLDDIMATAFIDDANFLIAKQHVEDESSNTEMEVTYSDYEKVEQYSFPFQADMNVTGDNEINVDLTINSVELNPSLNFPFSISKNYDKKEL